MKKRYQIGIMGSDTGLNYSKETEEFAKELGKVIAKKGVSWFMERKKKWVHCQQWRQSLL